MTDPTDLECWYEALKAYTFPTTFLPLNELECQCIVDAYEDYKQGSTKITDDPQKIETLEVLKAKIDEEMKRVMIKEGDGAFVRLSTRSPKDAVLRDETKIKKLLDLEMKNLGVTSYEDVEHTMIAVIRAAIKCMRVTSGAEAVKYMCRSERSYHDLFARLLNYGQTEKFQMNVVVRQWVETQPEWEFRGFVSKGKMTALTQYFKSCYVRQLSQNKNEIAKKIVALQEEVHPLIGLDSYTIDFVVTPEKIWIIELNTFGPQASPSLFNWAEDNEVMNYGPFECRVLKGMPKRPKSMLAQPLRNLLGWTPEPEEEERSCVIS
ncbi:hypothetical protein PROFUN_05118 [Planoprotostelium fungivorum]|uniref:Cell division cycle protein 123 n=1 Tax=Planoprotostelium fungivorum TaxID=1890364 RepID=A0A2P6NRQ1_9EUKA|nr:hypothetical protein PROFUN_05118 [Planoprotostelium fungivorum]